MRQLSADASSSALPSLATATLVQARPSVRSKFLFVGSEKLYVRGVTYGTFCPDPDGHEYPRPDIVESDFAQMRALGINAVRTYTVPPKWLLDGADRKSTRLNSSHGSISYAVFCLKKKKKKKE